MHPGLSSVERWLQSCSPGGPEGLGPCHLPGPAWSLGSCLCPGPALAAVATQAMNRQMEELPTASHPEPAGAGADEERSGGAVRLPTAGPHVHGRGLRGSAQPGTLGLRPGCGLTRGSSWGWGPAGQRPVCCPPRGGVHQRGKRGREQPSEAKPRCPLGSPRSGVWVPTSQWGLGRPTKAASPAAASLPESEHGEPASRSGHSEAAAQAPQCRLGLRPRTLGPHLSCTLF